MRKLLYVEDNEDNLYMLLGGYELLSARDGAAGIAMAASQRPDLILMDLNLPQIDGWEATRRLKADPARLLAVASQAPPSGPDWLDQARRLPHHGTAGRQGRAASDGSSNQARSGRGLGR